MPVVGDWVSRYSSRCMSAHDALLKIRSGNRVFLSPGCGEPQHLLEELVKLGGEQRRFNDVEIVHMLTVWTTWTSSTATAPTRRRRWRRRWARWTHVVRSGRALYAGISILQPRLTRRAAAILRDLGTPCLIHQPSYNMFNRWVEDGAAGRAGRGGDRLHRLLAAGAGPADRTATWTASPRTRARPSRTASCARSRSPRSKSPKVRQLNEMAAGARPDAGADGAGLGAAPSADDLGARSAPAACAQIEDAVGALDNLAFSEEELAAIEGILTG